MAVTFPSAFDAGVDRANDFGHCCDYERFFRRKPGFMGRDYKISIRVDDKGQLQRPCVSHRGTDAYQRPEWEPVPTFLQLPDYVTHEIGRLERSLTRLLKTAKAAAANSGQPDYIEGSKS